MPSKLTDLPLRPSCTRVTRGSFGDNVPVPVLEMGRMIIDHPYANLGDGAQAELEATMRANFAFVHVPTRHAFQGRFHVKQAWPPEVKQCRETDRLWLVGLGLPGREELEEVEEAYPYYDPSQGKWVDEVIPVTASTFPDDTVLVFTEVSWHEYRHASAITDGFAPWVRVGLCKHYQMPERYLLGLVLATPAYDVEFYNQIAYNAHLDAGPEGIDPSVLG